MRSSADLGNGGYGGDYGRVGHDLEPPRAAVNDLDVCASLRGIRSDSRRIPGAPRNPRKQRQSSAAGTRVARAGSSRVSEQQEGMISGWARVRSYLFVAMVARQGAAAAVDVEAISPPLPLPPLSPLLHVSAPPPVAVDAPASTPPDLTVACCRGACRYTIVCDVCGPNCASRDAAAHASEHAVTHVRRLRGGVALPPAPRMSLDSKPLLSGAAEARASRARLMPLGANQQREIP